jgi:excinuclease ABC subunit C
MAFRGERDLFDQERIALCMQHDLGHCLGPCAAACSLAQYEARVRAVRRFLSGRDRSILSQLEIAMQVASKARRFEQAATLRDSWKDLRELDQRLRRLRRVHHHYNFVYPLPNQGDSKSGGIWCLVRRGHAAAAAPQPQDSRTAECCLQLLQSVYDGDNGNKAGREDWDVVLLVSAWFRRNPSEFERTLRVDEAKRLCLRLAADAAGSIGRESPARPAEHLGRTG